MRVVLALGLWGLVWLIGFALSLRQSPHTLGADVLTLRFGQLRTARVRLADVSAARVAVTEGVKRTLEVSPEQSALSVMGETSVRLTLRPGATVDLEARRCRPSGGCSSPTTPAAWSGRCGAGWPTPCRTDLSRR
ncbi:hypothetical protein [Modestobacter sp. SYSU DS0657]